VQVVAKTEVIDEISHGKLATVYHYRHGYWDGAEREFRGFGRVDTYDTESFEQYNSASEFYKGKFVPSSSNPLHINGQVVFDTVNLEHYSPPTLTKNWFQLGPVGGEFGDWKELTFSEEYWQQDPNVLKRPAQTLQMLKDLPRRLQRDAIRTLRGNTLRSETYTYNYLQGPAARPFSVSENRQGIQLLFVKKDPLRAETGRYGILFRMPNAVFFPFAHASRSSQWEEGSEPLTTFSFSGEYDNYGHPLRSASLALPQGIIPPYTQAVGTQPNQSILATLSTSKYIYKDTAENYLCDRLCQSASYEALQDPGQNVFDMAEQLMQQQIITNGSTNLLPLSCSLNYYDGQAFSGLPFGQVGKHGAVVRTENLVITNSRIHDAYGSNTPQCFKSSPDYSTYPTDFQNSLQNNDPRLGYQYLNSPNHIAGWYSCEVKNKYDFQDAQIASPKGLLLQSKDAFDNLSEIIYDTYRFLPLEARQYYSATHYLSTQAEYDYRLFKPVQVSDENQNRSRFEYSPLGLLKSTALIGQAGKNEGDIVSENPLVVVPSTWFEYDLNAFYNSQSPVWVKSFQREKHWQQDPTHNSPTLQKAEYSDGFGRLLQTRAQAEDLIFGATPGERLTGNSGLPAEQNANNQNAIGKLRSLHQAHNVVVSGWKVYNNKGMVVEEYEPFFSSGFAYQSSKQTQYQLAKMRIKYDAGGRPTETTHPDGSKNLVVYGAPHSITAPPLGEGAATMFSPSPWVRFAYDQNDLGSLTNTSQAYTGAFTPKSEHIDALGRTLRTTEHLAQSTENVVMRYEYDIQGNLKKVIDTLGRQAFRYWYDLKQKRDEEDSGANVLKTIHIDKGEQITLYDASFKPIELKDAKGSWVLNAYDKLQRPTQFWGQDITGESITLRQFFEYGTDVSKNLLGKLHKLYDEAGLIVNEEFDFKGNLLKKHRQTLKHSELLSVFDGPPANWNVQCYRVDWTGLNTSILSTKEFRTITAYDALNRITRLTYPDDADNVANELVPTYNNAGALEKVIFNNETYVEHIAYNAKGQRILLALGNQIMTRYTYDTQTFRLLRQRSEKYIRTHLNGMITYAYYSGTNKQDYHYQYDLVGNILKITDKSPEAGVGGSASLERNF
jgi:YD repeat-containing protein